MLRTFPLPPAVTWCWGGSCLGRNKQNLLFLHQKLGPWWSCLGAHIGYYSYYNRLTTKTSVLTKYHQLPMSCTITGKMFKIPKYYFKCLKYKAGT